MTQRSQAVGNTEGSSGLVALLPLAMVFAAIAFLAVGAGRSGPDDKPAREARPLTSTQAAEMADAEKAAADAVVAISLARVAPALPEEALEPPKPRAQQTSSPDGGKGAKPVAKREAQLHPAQGAGKPMQIAKTPEAAPVVETKPAEQTPENGKPKDDGFLARIGSYAPSPSRIAGALSDGVSKLASYIPGL